MNERHHRQCFSFVNQLNEVLLQVIDQVKSYRVELGVALQLGFESYANLMIQ